MLNKLKYSFFAVITLYVIIVSAGCHSYRTPEHGPEIAYNGSISKKSVDKRQLIRSADLKLACYNIKEKVDSIKEVVKNNDGYFSQINVEENKSAYMKIIVPAENLDKTLTELKNCGSEIKCNVYVYDVTRKIKDLDAVLKNKKALRERLRALLKRAEKVSEVLDVEKELTRLQIEIDKLEGTLKSYCKDVKESKITLELRRHRVYGPLGYIFKGTFWVLEKLFVISS
jgi:hypothetical protein